ncbi:EF-hand domain-containing protein [Chloropicon primus]|uniref:EF-hand domain-containing protein n=1 Tax=Chloropicon primus TaxID=1764295 RepID=A0A5B8MPZ2_9CHLO|nr:hypothetical protein A3770_07p49290 [Chloropicon primus]UPR01629.1 EF-hand domain-containing protein [Chloropicon primus]|eukprot:QDZ22411.1 hypothetical protein A3770_07p49290 [Chloropicon primus]
MVPGSGDFEESDHHHAVGGGRHHVERGNGNGNEPNSPLCRSALIEWHMLSSRAKSKEGRQEFSHSSGISTSTTQTSCVRDEDAVLVPPLVQNTSMSGESRLKMHISRKDLDRIEQGSRSSTYNKRASMFSGEESNSSFASQSSDHLHQTVAHLESHGLGAENENSNEGGEDAGGFDMSVMTQAAIANMESLRDDTVSRRKSLHASNHYEAIDVVKAMTSLASQSKSSVRDVFNHFDRDKDGLLDREDLLLMIRQLIPSLSVHERCYLIENLISFDSSGGLTYPDIKRICVLIGVQTSPCGSNVIRGWPSAVHTSVATIHSSDFSKSGSYAQTNSKLSSNSQSSFENEAWAAQRQGHVETDPTYSEDPSPEQGHHRSRGQGVTPLTKARRRSSLMLGDALLRVNFQGDDDESNGCLSPKVPQPSGSPPHPRYGITDDSTLPAKEEILKKKKVQTFLGSCNGEMKLMARGELPAVLKEIFQKIYADGSDFLHTSSAMGMSMEVSKWCKSFVHGGYIRTIKLVTKHPRLGTLQTLDTQRMVWGADKKTLIVENRTMTPDFPNGLQWRVERRCVYVQVSPGVVLLTITAGVHIIHPFFKAKELQKAVERTLPEDARSHFQAIYNTVLLDKIQV